MPPPTMHTSTCTFSWMGPHSGIAAVADQMDSWRGMASSRKVTIAPLAKNTPGSGAGFLPQGDELFRHGRVDADRRVELRLGGAEFHGDGHALDDLARVRA